MSKSTHMVNVLDSRSFLSDSGQNEWNLKIDRNYLWEKLGWGGGSDILANNETSSFYNPMTGVAK